MAPHYTGLNSTAQHCPESSCTLLHCIVLHCNSLHSTKLHCTALHSSGCTALHCSSGMFTALSLEMLGGYYSAVFSRHCRIYSNKTDSTQNKQGMETSNWRPKYVLKDPGVIVIALLERSLPVLWYTSIVIHLGIAMSSGNLHEVW